MTQAWMRGMGISRTVEGFFAGAGDDTLHAVEGTGNALKGVLNALAKRVGMTPQELQEARTATEVPAGAEKPTDGETRNL